MSEELDRLKDCMTDINSLSDIDKQWLMFGYPPWSIVIVEESDD